MSDTSRAEAQRKAAVFASSTAQIMAAHILAFVSPAPRESRQQAAVHAFRCWGLLCRQMAEFEALVPAIAEEGLDRDQTVAAQARMLKPNSGVQ